MILILFLFFNILFIFIYLAILGLNCCMGFSLVAVQGLLIGVAALVVEHRLWVCRHWELEHMGSVIVAPGL